MGHNPGYQRRQRESLTPDEKDVIRAGVILLVAFFLLVNIGLDVTRKCDIPYGQESWIQEQNPKSIHQLAVCAASQQVHDFTRQVTNNREELDQQGRVLIDIVDQIRTLETKVEVLESKHQVRTTLEGQHQLDFVYNDNVRVTETPAIHHDGGFETIDVTPDPVPQSASEPGALRLERRADGYVAIYLHYETDEPPKLIGEAMAPTNTGGSWLFPMPD